MRSYKVTFLGEVGKPATQRVVIAGTRFTKGETRVISATIWSKIKKYDGFVFDASLISQPASKTSKRTKRTKRTSSR